MATDYDLLERQLASLLDGERDRIANAANFAAFIYTELPAINWAGFYFPDGSELLLGPFGGKPASSRLPPREGVCQRAFRERKTIVVDDVSALADHIYCDPASKSEMVVPLIVDGETRGVFDIDSPELARFQDVDRTGIERMVARFLKETDL